MLQGWSQTDSDMWKRSHMPFFTGEVLHFPLKRAVTSVLAMCEVYILQSCCGMTVPRPTHAQTNAHMLWGGNEQSQWVSTQ